MRTLKTIIIFFLCIQLNARDLSINESKIVASGIMSSYSFFKKQRAKYSISTLHILKNQKQTIAYAFDLQPKGFLILSSNTSLKPIVAFSDKSKLFTDDINDNTMLILLRRELSSRLYTLSKLMTQRGGNATDLNLIKTFEKTWANLLSRKPFKESSSRAISQVGPSMSSYWGQGNDAVYSNDSTGSPTYNYYTPNNYPTGCIATSIGQIMKYHAWPNIGEGTHSYKWAETQATLTANYAHSYDWNNILNDYSYPFEGTKSSTLTQRQNVGQLLYDCGIALNMNYTASYSSSYLNDVPAAFKNHFKYEDSDFFNRNDTGMTDSIFFSRINTNLLAQYPVMIGIPGHALVADGIRQEGSGTVYYHMNFGWSGSNSGWYDIQNTFTSTQNDSPLGMGTAYSSTSSKIWTGGADSAVVNIIPQYNLLTPAINNTDIIINWEKGIKFNHQATELQEAKLSASTSFFDDLSTDISVWTSSDSRTKEGTYFGRLCGHSFLGDSKTYDWFTDRVLTSNKTFLTHSNTTLSYAYKIYYASGQVANLQIKSNTEPNWTTIKSYDGDSGDVNWTTETIQLNNVNGVDYSDKIISLRFTFSYNSGQSAYSAEGYGFFIDDFRVDNTGILTDWTTLNNTITTTSYTMPIQTSGQYYFRVRGKTMNTWQSWSRIKSVGYGGIITCTVLPDLANTQGALWKLTQGADTTWHSSTESVTLLPFRSYMITFADIAGFRKPIDTAININSTQTTSINANYARLAIEAPETPSATVTNSIHIKLTWIDASIDETGFLVERKVGTVWSTVADLSANTTSYNVFPLKPNTQYFYRITSYKTGESAVSSEISASTPALPSIDINHNNIEDEWESLYPSSSDADNFSLYEEYMGGTSPNITDQSYSITLTLNPGWNLISFPCNFPNPNFSYILQLNSSPVYLGSIWQWTGSGYIKANSAKPAIGYWVYSSTSTSINIYGYPISSSNISLDNTWNLIGPYSKSYLPTNQEISRIFYWDSLSNLYKRLISPEKLEATKAYWFNTSSICQISLDDNL